MEEGRDVLPLQGAQVDAVVILVLGLRETRQSFTGEHCRHIFLTSRKTATCMSAMRPTDAARPHIKTGMAKADTTQRTGKTESLFKQ